MKHPTMDDVAREADVSRALVSLVFRDSPKVADGSRSRVLLAAERLGYRPNAMARGLASRGLTTVGVLLRDIHNPFFADIVDGIEEAAEREDIQLLYGHAGRRAAKETAAIETLLEFRPGGLVLLSPASSSRMLSGQVRAVPTVVVGREVRREGLDAVVNDDARGACLAVEHLHGLGHRRIAHVSGGRDEAGASQRIRGYEHAMRTLGLEGQIRIMPGTFSEAAGVSAADELIRSRDVPSAVFAGNDLIAVGLLSGFDRAGVRVPEDVSLVGYDNSWVARIQHIGLTTIHQPRREMGELAIETLLQRLRHQRDGRVVHRTPPTLIVRSSSGPAPTAHGTKRS